MSIWSGDKHLSQLARWIAGWCDLLDGIVCILTGALITPLTGVRVRMLMFGWIRKRSVKLEPSIKEVEVPTECDNCLSAPVAHLVHQGPEREQHLFTCADCEQKVPFPEYFHPYTRKSLETFRGD